MRISLVVAAISFLRLCGSDAPPPPPGMPGAMPGMPGAVPGPVAGYPGMPPMMPGMPPTTGPVPFAMPPGPMAIPTGTVPGMPVMPGVPPIPAIPTPVTEVVAGPHQGTLIATAAAKFEIVVAATDVKVYVSDPAGAEIPPADVMLPVLTFEGVPAPTLVVLQAGQGFLTGTATAAPAANAVVRFDAVVRGTSLPGITATLTGTAAPAAVAEAPAAPPPAEAAPAPPAEAAPAAPAEPAPPAVTRTRPTKRQQQANPTPAGARRPSEAQTFAPQPLAPSSTPVRGNVAGSSGAPSPQPVQVQQPQRPRVVVTPGAGVISN